MPVDNQYADYVPMLAQALRVVAEVDRKSELQLLDDLETVAVGDIVSLRVANPLNSSDHTVRLDNGIEYLEQMRRMIRAAASSVNEARPVHPRRPTALVSEFIKGLLLGQTERGSYLFRLISPVAEVPLGAERPVQLPNMPTPDPFSRRSVIELIKGLKILRSAAQDNMSRERFVFEPFLAGVPNGVSANLCEALAPRNSELNEESIPFDIGVTWSYSIPATKNLTSEVISFEPPMLPYIRQAAKEFRARNPETLQLTGWVKILEKESPQGGVSLIRLISRLDGKTRSVKIELEDEDYSLAIRAHSTNSLVSVTGELRVENNSFYQLIKPRGFSIVEQDALFDLSDYDE
jgi:hypothetical protein